MMLDDTKYEKSNKFIVVSQKAPEIGHYFLLLDFVNSASFCLPVMWCNDVFDTEKEHCSFVLNLTKAND